MTRKNALRDTVRLVRSRLPDSNGLSREQIELALLHYDFDVDATVEAFQRNGAIDALSGWTEMAQNRENNASKRTNRKAKVKPQAPSNAPLRPSQRVSNLFQSFAEGATTSLNTSVETSSIDRSPVHVNDSPSTSMVESIPSEDKERRNSVPSPRRKSQSTNHSEKVPTTMISNNRKLLTKSSKDLQRQTSTLANVEISFNNEMKLSLKRIDDVFKEIREILKEREVELYLQMDRVKEQGLNIIHRRQQRAVDLRQRLDRCDRLEPNEIEQLRSDIKQFVTDRRYDLGEELTSTHRFEFDPKTIENLKQFGHVLTINRSRTISSSSALIEAKNEENHNGHTTDSQSISSSSLPTDRKDSLVSANSRKTPPKRPPYQNGIHSLPTSSPKSMVMPARKPARRPRVIPPAPAPSIVPVQTSHLDQLMILPHCLGILSE